MSIPVPDSVERKSTSSRLGYSLSWLVLLLCCAGLALLLRCLLLEGEELSNDESFSWRLTEYSPKELTLRTGADVHPPLYYLLLKVWVALWGLSPGTLRGLSVLLGVLCVPVIYAVCFEACAASVASRALSATAARVAALFSACLLAVHVSQVTPSRTARMYTLGVLLAGLTSWLLLRAVRAQRRQELWWSAYSLAVAAFCYTHYYAFFTVLAQALFLAGDLLVRRWRHGSRETLAPLAGFAFAGAVALILYSPWLPVLRDQVRGVRQGYWIPGVTAHETRRVFFSWSTGAEYQESWEFHLWLLLLSGCVLWGLARGGRAGWFFILQAAVPWLLSLGISFFSGRSIFVERYLAFAQFALLAFWGLVFAVLPGPAWRLVFAGLLSTAALSGLLDAADQWPRDRPAIAKAADFLKGHHQPGDEIWVEGGPPAVNRLRFYLIQAGVAPVVVRCHERPFAGGGHMAHIAALSADDLIWNKEQAEVSLQQRLWRGSESGGFARIAAQGMRLVLERTFGGGGTTYSITLFERQK